MHNKNKGIIMKKTLFCGTVLAGFLSAGCGGTVSQSEVQAQADRCSKILKDAGSYSSFAARYSGNCYTCTPYPDLTPFIIAYTACRKSLNEMKSGRTEIPL